MNFDNIKFVERNLKNLHQINKMNNQIKSSGGLFYQYRPCRIDGKTIYDIENIIHGVVYARSPLYMNDPFDSEIGFSTEKVIDDIIDMFLLDYKGVEMIKDLMRFIIKNKLLGNFAELVKGLNDLKKELKILLPNDLTQQQKNNIRHHIDSAIRKLPKHIQKIFNKRNTNNILLLIFAINELEITEENVCDIVGAQKILDEAIAEIDRIKETVFEGAYKEFLSTINISCFTASGWQNALMWAHYANSYEGICIEYDFNKIKDFIGFIGAVDYKHPRPIISIKDLGTIKEGKFVASDITDEAIWKLINYLLVKDKIWEYEKEWRIIAPQGTPAPSFIALPFIKSITMGTKISPLIKNWIISICKDKHIDCYNLKLSYDTFEIDRVPVDTTNYGYDIEEDSNFLLHLCDKITELTEKLNPLTTEIDKNTEEKRFDYDLIFKSLSIYEDVVISSFFSKNIINRMALNNKELLLYYGETIKETVKYIDKILEQKITFIDLKNQTAAFVLCGLINFKQKETLDKKLNDIINLMEYYSEQELAIDDLKS